LAVVRSRIERASRVAAGFVVASLAGACGGARPPVDTSEFGDGHDAGPDAGYSGSLSFEGGGAPPPCVAEPDGGVCGCLELSLVTDQPNLYFVLDRSGSMSENDKWGTVRSVVADVIVGLGPRARFGAAVFPDPRTDVCGAGIEVMAPRLGDAPAGQAGPTVGDFTSSTAFVANGGTPTAATLSALTAELTALPQKTFVILATDGGPNCDAAITCDVSECIPNIEQAGGCSRAGPTNCCDQDATQCLDVTKTVQAVQDLAAGGVPTYVIGVPGSGPYSAVLDRMAVAGGTARPTEPAYYAVSTTDQTALAAALKSIAAKITATCTLTLDQPPPDPAQVNVYLDGVVVPKDRQSGWTLSGSTVTLVGATCDRVMSGDALDLRVIAGCPTVLK
jgi:hypothetical protein